MAFDPVPSSPTANSYLSLERLTVLVSEDAYPVSVPDDPKKQALLITGTRNLETILCPSGTITVATQALKFPRKDLTNSEGQVYDENLIPLPIELALYKLYKMLSVSDIFAKPDVIAQGLTLLKADTIELRFSEGQSFNLIPSEVQTLIPSDWICKVKSNLFIFASY